MARTDVLRRNETPPGTSALACSVEEGELPRSRGFETVYFKFLLVTEAFEVINSISDCTYCENTFAVYSERKLRVYYFQFFCVRLRKDKQKNVFHP